MRRGLSCVHRHAKWPATRDGGACPSPDRAGSARCRGAGSPGCPRYRSLLGPTPFLQRPSLMSSRYDARVAVEAAGPETRLPGRCESLSQTRLNRRHAVWRACRSFVSPSFGLSRPMRPRFGMSNRRPSSLRSASITRPQRPFSAFFPWPLCAHSSRDKKASPWPPSTAWRPFGCGPIASGQRQPSRSRWSRPEKRKRTRTWLPSATSP